MLVMLRRGLNRIEKHFNMTFRLIIENLHWSDHRSIKSLSDECGISRDTFQKNAKRMGITLRSAKESAKLNPNKGIKHWAYGKNKDNSEIHRKSSERMRLNNPSHNDIVLEKNMISFSKYLKENLSKHEIIFIDLLKEHKVDFIVQHPFGRYILDFFIPDLNIAIELDSKDSWDKTRKLRAYVKDAFLKKKDIYTLRIGRTLVINHLNIVIDILKAFDIIV